MGTYLVPRLYAETEPADDLAIPAFLRRVVPDAHIIAATAAEARVS